ncbi:hypothetical protein [Sphingomonas sp. IW22]|uniref:hypothetical protein n=1 Tax=Sphingomonas sp. IW22 TaxID=3242489 RepID=UPI0035209F80
MLLAHRQRIVKLDRLRLPGSIDAGDKSTSRRQIKNLRKMAKIIPLERRASLTHTRS